MGDNYIFNFRMDEAKGSGRTCMNYQIPIRIKI